MRLAAGLFRAHVTNRSDAIADLPEAGSGSTVDLEGLRLGSEPGSSVLQKVEALQVLVKRLGKTGVTGDELLALDWMTLFPGCQIALIQSIRAAPIVRPIRLATASNGSPCRFRSSITWRCSADIFAR